MQEIFDVNTGEVVVKNGDFTLRALAIGSCIVIAAYDSKTKNSGMAHIMLPGVAPAKATQKTRYASDGIDEMLMQMSIAGSVYDNIEVCLIGAGNVLKKPDDSICENNIKSVNSILKKHKIKVNASVLGGYQRKSAFLDSKTGNISYTQGDSKTMPLWPI